MLHRQLVPEQAERVDVEDPVRATGDVVTEQLVAVRRERVEDEQEEQRHDRQVVAGETPRRQPDQVADDRPDRGHDRDHEQRRQVVVELVGGEDRVRVRTDSEEGDVAEVEQPTPADHDVEPERQQDVDDGVEGDPADVTALEAERQQAGDPDEEREPRPPGHRLQPALERPQHAGPLAPVLAVARDPLVATDRRAGLAFRGRRLERALERLAETGIVWCQIAHRLRPS